eukprot:snap_masked-scaffold_4-processed-gene-6.28-mRNA-1 protein AED:1.00 eAED:1.00 QI:0/0/0/0/1/1/2/0/154
MKRESTFCGHHLTEHGHRLDKRYAVDLLGRRKAKYVHELAQLIFIGNWVAEKYSIVGNIKALERKKELILWDREMDTAHQELLRKLEESFTAMLGYFDAKLDVILFVDAPKKHWAYFICQTEGNIDLKQILYIQFRVITMSSGEFVGSTLDWHI